MFYPLYEELVNSLPQTEAQRRRLNRGIGEADDYLFTNRSDHYGEPAVFVHNPHTGRTYLTFTTTCSCPDFQKHGPVVGDGSIECCKHQVAAWVNGEFVGPAVKPADYAAPFADEEPCTFPEPELPLSLLTWEPLEERFQEEDEALEPVLC